MIQRYTPGLQTKKNDGGVILVHDLLEYLREKRSEFLSDNDGARRFVIEDLIKQLGEKP